MYNFGFGGKPRTFALKMAIAVFSETLENFNNRRGLSPKANFTQNVRQFINYLYGWLFT
jgi:hypothetical protein